MMMMLNFFQTRIARLQLTAAIKELRLERVEPREGLDLRVGHEGVAMARHEGRSQATLERGRAQTDNEHVDETYVAPATNVRSLSITRELASSSDGRSRFFAPSYLSHSIKELVDFKGYPPVGQLL